MSGERIEPGSNVDYRFIRRDESGVDRIYRDADGRYFVFDNFARFYVDAGWVRRQLASGYGVLKTWK